MSALERAIDELGRLFLGKLGIIAFADGEEDGAEVVIAMVDTRRSSLAAVRKSLPERVHGVPVRVRPSGRLIAHA